MRRFIGALMLSGVLMTPALIQAKDRDDRIYDRDRRDYHRWNPDEERAYRHWVQEERHQQYREYHHAGKRDQREYWRWRHEHMDWR